MTTRKREQRVCDPSSVAKKPQKPVKWPDYKARLKRIFGDQPRTGATAAELIDYLHGDY